MHKKILALILSVTMLLSTGATVFANETPYEAPFSQAAASQQEEHSHPEISPGVSFDETTSTSDTSMSSEPPQMESSESSDESASTPDTLIPIEPPKTEASKASQPDKPLIVDSGVPPVEIKDERKAICGLLDWDENHVPESTGGGKRPRLVGSRVCNVYGCTTYVVVTTKYDKFCDRHRCTTRGCFNIRANSSQGGCRRHLGLEALCQYWDGSSVCRKPADGPYNCTEHWCTYCDGTKEAYELKCEYCCQCWVPGCPKLSTCGNECDTHCPHTCKTHHQNHCLTCHSSPCICYPVNPNISVSAWNKTNNSITATISSTRATQIEIYTSGGTKVTTINGASGSFAFYHNAAYNNGSYYVRVKNAVGYNTGKFPFTISGLDRAAPASPAVSLTPSGWASSKTLVVTATDQTNVRFELRYADGTLVPYCTAKEGTVSGGKFTTSWSISEHITAAKSFRLVSTDRWGYSSSYNFTMNQIDTAPPTPPTITKSPSKEWHNGNVSLTIGGSSAASGIAGYEYRINSGSWQSGSTLTLSAQGTYTVEARALSNAAIRSSVTSTTVKIDTTKPGGSYTLSRQPGKWATEAVTITLSPTDAGGSGVKSVTLPNGQIVTNLNNVTHTASQNGSYAFTVTDNAGNSSSIIVAVENIAMLDVTVTLSTPFVISPDEDAIYGGDLRFENHSNVPVALTMQQMEPLNGAPQIVAPDSHDWKSLSVRDTPKYVALGFVGNGKDFWKTDAAQSLGIVNKDSDATFSLKAKHGYAWENPRSLLYAMTVKVTIQQ